MPALSTYFAWTYMAHVHEEKVVDVRILVIASLEKGETCSGSGETKAGTELY